MTRDEALLKLLAVEPEYRCRLIVITGWHAEETEAVLDDLVAQGKVTCCTHNARGIHGERVYYTKGAYHAG